MVILLALTTVASTTLGGLFALRNRDRLHLILGFTAGVILGVVAFNVLPEMVDLSQSTGIDFGVPMIAGGRLPSFHVVEKSILIHESHEVQYSAHSHPAVGLAGAGAVRAQPRRRDRDRPGLPGRQQRRRRPGRHRARLRRRDQHDGPDAGPRQQPPAVTAPAVARRRRPLVGAASTLLFTLSDTGLLLYLGAFTGFLLYIGAGDILPEGHANHPSRLTPVRTIAGTALMWVLVRAIAT